MINYKLVVVLPNGQDGRTVALLGTGKVIVPPVTPVRQPSGRPTVAGDITTFDFSGTITLGPNVKLSYVTGDVPFGGDK